MIANSGHDERGRYSYGQAGDQTGTEWNIIKWYSRPWDCVLRYETIKIANAISDLAIEAAMNDNIGYDQTQRLTFWEELSKVGYHPNKIKTKCESDCSAGVSAIVKAVGYLYDIQSLKDIAPSNWTGIMRVNFSRAGFKVLTDSKYTSSDKYLKPGDILLNEQHHVAINLDYGSELKGYEGGFPIIPPNLKKGVNGLQVQRLQKFLNWYYGCDLPVKGVFGVNTEKQLIRFQKECGLSGTGSFGKFTLKYAKEVKK